MQADGATEEGAQMNPSESGMSLVGGSGPMERREAAARVGESFL